ncbi:hypothetical protein ANO11243_048050 [Dothideomycetidae sp. 11243]|nr:hypothetical protein ANO11243_048050 [fungal sp. No.11243]
MRPNLFIASMGNPGTQYALTRHSAGHIVLSSLATLLGSFPPPSGQTTTVLAPPAPPPPKRKRQSTDTPSDPPPSQTDTQAYWTLYQSDSYMNTSGPTILRAFNNYQSSSRSPCKLVILHDALDIAPGKLALRLNAQELSAKGHNGIKSLLAAVKSDRNGSGARDWVRLSVGIGRPESRDADVVAKYVLARAREGEVLGLSEMITSLLLQGLAGYGKDCEFVTLSRPTIVAHVSIMAIDKVLNTHSSGNHMYSLGAKLKAWRIFYISSTFPRQPTQPGHQALYQKQKKTKWGIIHQKAKCCRS